MHKMYIFGDEADNYLKIMCIFVPAHVACPKERRPRFFCFSGRGLRPSQLNNNREQ